MTEKPMSLGEAIGKRLRQMQNGKKMTLDITFNVPWDFTPGWCEGCPFREEKPIFDSRMGNLTDVSCRIGFMREECPLEERGEEDGNTSVR